MPDEYLPPGFDPDSRKNKADPDVAYIQPDVMIRPPIPVDKEKQKQMDINEKKARVNL